MSERRAYQRRTCDSCGRGLQPFMPRKRVGEQMMCPMCATNESHRMGEKTTRVAARTHQGGIDLATCPPEQGVAHFLAADKPDVLRVVAHDSGDAPS